VGRYEQAVNQLKMENSRLEQALAAIRNEAGNSNQQARIEIQRYEQVVTEMKSEIQKAEHVNHQLKG
jgi:predicted RNase H-like nuclease (RuvC/YqgF family)